jgi:cell wall-associated NlpC family hydrolase
MKIRLLLSALLVMPAGLSAQATTLSSFVASDGGVEGMPMLVGLTVAREWPLAGLRVSTAVDAGSTLGWSAVATEPGMARMVNTEFDALLFPFGPRSDMAVTPYALGGIGFRVRHDQWATNAGALWSYGAGGRAPLGSRLALEGEARYRQPLIGRPAAMPDGTSPGWEVRFGASVRIGRINSALRPVVATAPATPARSPSGGVLGTPITADGGGADARLMIAMSAIESGERLLGTRYRWGGNTPNEGFDCSGFVKYIFDAQGIILPRVSQDQARAGEAIPLDPAFFEPGDLIAFASNGRTVDHIAIYAGDGRILHSSSSGGEVRYDVLATARGSWYLRHMVAARRVISD